MPEITLDSFRDYPFIVTGVDEFSTQMVLGRYHLYDKAVALVDQLSKHRQRFSGLNILHIEDYSDEV